MYFRYRHEIGIPYPVSSLWGMVAAAVGDRDLMVYPGQNPLIVMKFG
jgi:hypothetical protein